MDQDIALRIFTKMWMVMPASGTIIGHLKKIMCTTNTQRLQTGIEIRHSSGAKIELANRVFAMCICPHIVEDFGPTVVDAIACNKEW